MAEAETELSTTEEAMIQLSRLVLEQRTMIHFTIAEKSQREYKTVGNSWKEVKAGIENGTLDHGGNDFNVDETWEFFDHYYEVDGSHEHLWDGKPTFDRKVKEVRIGYTWYDWADLMDDPEYYLGTSAIRRAIEGEGA